MSRMSELDLELREEQENIEDPWSYCEEGECAFVMGYHRNPHKTGSYAWSEWERGWLHMSKKESRDED